MKRSKVELDVVLEGIEDGIIAQNAAGKLLYANIKAAHLLGFTSVDQLTAKSVRELLGQFEVLDTSGRIVPLDMLPTPQALRGVQQLPQLLCYRTMANGEERWLLVKAIPIQDVRDSWGVENGGEGEKSVRLVVTLFRDVTAQKESEDARRQSEELFAKAFRVSPAALWVSILDTGVALDVNDSFLRITGYTREEVIGETTMSLGLWVDPKTRGRVIQSVRKHGSIRDMEFQFRRKSGELRDGLLSAEIADIQGDACLLISCVDITARKRAEAELNRLLGEVQAGREALQGLSRRLLEVQESERRYIARELHDQIGQVLTAVQINIEALERLPEARGLSARLEESVGLVDQALQQIRNLSLDLRPSLLDDLGLVSALLWYLDRQKKRTGIDIQLAVNPLDSIPSRLPPELETASFRIVQEALTNIARHAGAKHVTIKLCLRDDNLDVAVEDDGVGFDVRAARERASMGGSMGLLGMQERAELAGGRLTIESARGRGTIVRVLLPLRNVKLP